VALESVGVKALPTGTQVTVVLSGTVQYRVQTLPPSPDHPYRVFVDFEDTTLARTAKQPREIATGPVERVRTGQFTPTQARVVLDLPRPASYTVGTRGAPFRIVFNVESPPADERVTKPEIAPAATPGAWLPAAPPPKARPPVPAQESVLAAAPKPAPKPATSTPAAAPTAAAQPKPTPPPEPAPAIATAAKPAPAAPSTTAAPKPAVQPPPKATPPAPPETPRPVNAQAKTTAAAPPAAALPPPGTPLEPVTAGRATARREAHRGSGTRRTTTRPRPEPVEEMELRAVAWEPDAREKHGIETALPDPPTFSALPRVVIDPGHGGRDPGARSVDGVWEKDIVLELSRELAIRTRLRLGVEVVLTRNGDHTMSMAERVAYAAGDGSLFVSIHANAVPQSYVEGVQTFYPMSGDFGDDSRRLAQLVHHRIVTGIDASYGPVQDGGVRGRELAVLQRSRAPSLLVETAYLSNPIDWKRLNDTRYRDALIDGIIDGIADYLSGVGPPEQKVARATQGTRSQ
jgi:N-acetylmuramoyl-L-alanine amidase